MTRPAQPQDVEAVTALIHVAYRGYVPLLGRDPQPLTDDYAALIAAGEVFALEMEGMLAGVLVVQEPEWGVMLVDGGHRSGAAGAGTRHAFDGVR